MLSVQTKVTPEDFVPEPYRDAEGKAKDGAPVFTIRPLNTPEMTEAMGLARRGDAMGLVKAFECGCTGWRNITDENGKELRFTPMAKSLIPPTIVYEVGSRIIEISRLSDEDLGNS